MADAIGTLELPAPGQSGGEALADGNLQKVADYLKAFLADKLEANWQQVAPGTPFIKTLGLFNPEIAGLLSSDLPALFVYRSDMEEERMADDWYVDHSEITVLWLPNQVTQAQLTKRMPMLNGVAKAITMAVIAGRDPSWFDPGDPDTTARTLGSVLASRANLIREARLKSCKAALATIRSDKETAHYPCVRALIETHELTSWDLTLRGSPAAHQTTLTVNGQAVDVVRDPATPDP
jgi:predicted component of type VI protein secretion system